MELDDLPSTVIPPPAVTLTFHLLTSKSNQHIYELTYICSQNWVKFSSLFLFLRYGVHKFTFGAQRLTDPLTDGYTRMQNTSVLTAA